MAMRASAEGTSVAAGAGGVGAGALGLAAAGFGVGAAGCGAGWAGAVFFGWRLKIPAVEMAVEASSSAAALAVRGNRVIGETEMVSAGETEKGMRRLARRTRSRAMQAGNRRRCKLHFHAPANRIIRVEDEVVG
jgi:hypothetical protein